MVIVAAGEILWDVFDNAEHLGGATFNFAAHARRLGHEVWFVSAVGDDARGARALGRMRELGLSTRFVRAVPQATGIVTVKLEAGGQPRFTIHRPAAYDFAALDEADIAELAARRPDWIYFGTLYQITPQGLALTRRILDAFPAARRFYDINLRVDSYTPALVHELMSLATVVKLNDGEVEEVARMENTHSAGFEDFARAWTRRFGWEAVAITLGSRGSAVLAGGEYAETPGYRVEVADTVGAGDAFAAAFIHSLGQGRPAAAAGDFSNRIGAVVASHSGGTPEWTLEETAALDRA